MSNAVKSTLGISGAALFIILATNAKPLFEGLQAGWIFLEAIAKTATLGLSSFGLAIILATSVMWFLRKWIPEALHVPGKDGRSFLIELVVLCVGVFAVYFQLPTMLGLMVGTVAGLLAPLLYKGSAAMVGFMLGLLNKENKNVDGS